LFSLRAQKLLGTEAHVYFAVAEAIELGFQHRHPAMLTVQGSTLQWRVRLLLFEEFGDASARAFKCFCDVGDRQLVHFNPRGNHAIEEGPAVVELAGGNAEFLAELGLELVDCLGVVAGSAVGGKETYLQTTVKRTKGIECLSGDCW
jgi:hypothetical protein